MTIQLPQDLANLIEDAVQSGQYRAEDVIRDALVRLGQATAMAAVTSNQSDEPSLQKKPLTKQTLQRHLAEIGLVNQCARYPLWPRCRRRARWSTMRKKLFPRWSSASA